MRNAYASDLRLLQVDFAVRDDRKDKAPIGWVFGTFMYDGSQTADKVSNGQEQTSSFKLV